MIWLSVIGTLIRELVRAWIVPARLLLYLPQRHRWRRRAQEALSAATERSEPAGTAQLEAFFARQPARSGDRPHLFVSAGEASGEQHAARLVRALGLERLSVSKYVRGAVSLGDVPWNRPRPGAAWMVS